MRDRGRGGNEGGREGGNEGGREEGSRESLNQIVSTGSADVGRRVSQVKPNTLN